MGKQEQKEERHPGEIRKREITPEVMPEEVKEELRKAEGQRERDLLWTGDRTIKETYSKVSKLYSELAERLEDFVSGLPLGGLNISDKYSALVNSSKIISQYYQTRLDRVLVDGKLSERLYTPGWETIRVLSDLPGEILSEIKQDLQEETDSLFYGTASSTLREIGKTIDGQITFTEDLSLFPESPSMEDKEDYILQDRIAILRVLQITKKLEREIKEVRDKVSPKVRKRVGEYSRTTSVILDSLSRYLGKGDFKDIDLEEAKRRYSNSRFLREGLSDLLAEKEKYYTIQEINGQRRVIEYKSEDSPTTALEALRDLSNIEKSSKSGQIRVSKDLLETEILSKGDSLELIKSQKLKDHILKLQKKGKLLNGTLEGLSGGKAYFKIFTIALSQTLNEQSKYYQTEDSGSGLPLDLAKKYIGEGVKIEEGGSWELKDLKDSTLLQQEKRSYPYILISYEDLAKKMKGTDRIFGGKDSEYIRDYIESLQSKEYLLADGKGGIVGVRYIVKLASLYLEKSGKEVGCIVQLSPQFSKTIRGYSGLRGDTIKLLGGGQQKDITMNLLDILIYTRGISGGVYRKSKEDLLSQIATNKRYERSKKERERDFREAIKKAINSKIILKYKEERSSGGETISVFTFNSDYFKGEDIPEVEDQ